MVKWKRTLSLLMDLGNNHLQLVQLQVTVLTHYFNLIPALKKLYPTPPPQVTAPLKSGPKTCLKPPPRQLQEKFCPTAPPTRENNSPFGEPTPNNSGNTRYFSKKLHRTVTVSRGKKKSSTAVISKKKSKSTQISGEKQRLITSMLGIVPLETSTDQDLASLSQVLENESSSSLED